MLGVRESVCVRVPLSTVVNQNKNFIRTRTKGGSLDASVCVTGNLVGKIHTLKKIAKTVRTVWPKILKTLKLWPVAF